MVKVTEALIKKIITLGQSPDDKKQLAAAHEMCGKVFPNGECVDPAVIPRLLPTIVKLMDSEE